MNGVGAVAAGAYTPVSETLGTKTEHQVNGDDAAELRAAAFRLRHDVGKRILFDAPNPSGTDAEPLRAHLVQVLAGTPESRQPLAEVLAFWLASEAGRFAAIPAHAARLAAFRKSAAELGRDASALESVNSLDRAALEAVDRRLRALAELTRVFYREVIEAELPAEPPAESRSR